MTPDQLRSLRQAADYDGYDPWIRDACRAAVVQTEQHAQLLEACRDVRAALRHYPHWQPTMPAHLEAVLGAALAAAPDATADTKP